MYKGKKIYVMYRALYGEDFIQESINSISDYADKIFFNWTDRPFGGLHCVEYKNDLIRIPKKIDNIVDKVKELNNDKVVLIKKHYKTNANQFTLLYNNEILPKYGSCDILIMMEVDHVFKKDQIELALDEFIEKGFTHATTEQWEIWKGFRYTVPQRCDKEYETGKISQRWRMCTMFWNLENLKYLPKTRMHCDAVSSQYKQHRLKAKTHNLGFAWSYKTMYWKHVISLGISYKVGDSPPNENWFEDMWVNWDAETNNKNLEQSTGYEHTIPTTVPYDVTDLPESIYNNLDYFISKNFDTNTK